LQHTVVRRTDATCVYGRTEFFYLLQLNALVLFKATSLKMQIA